MIFVLLTLSPVPAFFNDVHEVRSRLDLVGAFLHLLYRIFDVLRVRGELFDLGLEFRVLTMQRLIPQC